MRGKLIAIEGTDGSGKATQTKLLVDRLKKEGKPAESISFPRYGKWSAIFVEKFQKGEFGKIEDVSAQQCSFFYGLDRYAASLEFKKWLEEGKHVISDRYTTSSLAHQAAKIKNPEEKAKFSEWLLDMEYNKLKIPKPDLVIFLHVHPEITRNLIKEQGHKSGSEKDITEKFEHQKKSEQTYLEFVEKYGWIKIDCTENNQILSRKKIAEKVWNVATKVLF